MFELASIFCDYFHHDPDFAAVIQFISKRKISSLTLSCEFYDEFSE